MSRRRNSAARSAPAIDIVIASERWQAAPEAEKVIRRAVAEAACAVSTTTGELAIVLTDDSAICALNRDWRGKDEPTNVLSFPAAEPQPDAPVLLGDIVIAYETSAREALAEGKPFMHHLAHLAVHGFLHLVGYDHETDKQADAMETLEATVLARLDVPNPYLTRDVQPRS
jgi:probable rRNA maturation factor